MIDTDKYEGCQTDHALTLYKRLLCPTVFMDVDGSGEIVPTLDRGIAWVYPDIPVHYLRLLEDAPLLLEEVKRLREVIDTIGYFMTGGNKENPAFDWSSRQTIANLDAEVKRLREGRLDIIKKAADILTSHGIDCADLHDYIIDRLVNE